MKLLKRNTTEFEYLPPDGTTTDMNDDGDHTGDFRPTHGTPVTYRGNISAPSGHTNQQFYGEEVRYSHTLVMDKPDADIEETGIIRWKGNTYTITAVRRSLNVLNVALQQQGPPEEDPPETDPVGITGMTGGEPEGEEP